MKVAVVGAGYAGLATCWYLKKQRFDVTVYDTGHGASIASTGLMHPYPGKDAKLSYKGFEALEESNFLINVAESAIGKKVCARNGILKLANTELQAKNWPNQSFWIKEGVTVFSRIYLEGLKKACNIQVQNQKVLPEDLNKYDLVIWSTGAQTIWDFGFKRTIGQALLCQVNHPLEHSIIKDGHISLTEDPNFVWVGSTYEHTQKPDPKKAIDLLKKVSAFYLPANDFKIIEVVSGVRIAPKVGYMPIIKKIDNRSWLFTGLGSRGLLYHAFFAKQLVEDIVLSLSEKSK
jgi:glycine/D-amino acid oxidase-like deaminating enzyme